MLVTVTLSAIKIFLLFYHKVVIAVHLYKKCFKDFKTFIFVLDSRPKQYGLFVSVSQKASPEFKQNQIQA